MTGPEQHRVLETRTGEDTLERIQQVLDETWAAHEIPDIARMHVELAVSEIASNIIEHSADGKPVRLRMEVALLPDAVRITFTDDGHAAPVDLSTVAMPDDTAERGRGLAIAHRVLDEISYRRDADGNHWTLVRRLST
ncbi:anti-sigma regulatory factor [Mycolicibacterium duvalii]|uniref:ATP-binding protein n=1 Tax=Mycolicibacterium duvalii TaxID=39688 RepID=UPI000BEED107|nr:ATP-binding protein [Mycolicibacterium duvalii]MCV7366907.1 ATP-binding protein [Mycolicibacterium duvalii]PEG44018.1 anti-sigma regulatory factor [Mycolicibacterium duvalii]